MQLREAILPERREPSGVCEAVGGVLSREDVKRQIAANDQVISWEGHAKQDEFLAASEFEVLYGGAAGGGKTDAILIDALGLQQKATDNRNYQAIIFRRTFPDLKDLIDRSQQLFPVIIPGAKYDKVAHVWKFPSGARLEFGHIQYEADRFKYRGRAFQYIGWEELSLWPTSVPYLYLLSRLRSADPSIKCYCRSNTNPDGPGAKWVKDYWKIGIVGNATRFDISLVDPETHETTVRVRRFIPARLSDNPHLNDSGYRQTLLMLDTDTRDALLLGRWEPLPVKGAYYAKEIDLMREQGRIGIVPYLKSVPVNTFWDIGGNDTTAIVCHQFAAMQHRFIDGYENNEESLSHYAKWLMDTGYVFGTHYLPHDAGSIRVGLNDNRSWLNMLQDLMPGHKFVVVPRINDVTVGIELTRQRLDESVWDELKCGAAIAAMTNYRKEYDEKMLTFKRTPYHDWASNYADAVRQWAQGFQFRNPIKKHDWRDRIKNAGRSAMSS